MKSSHGHTSRPNLKVICQITGRELALQDAVPVDLVRDALIPILREKCPTLSMDGYVALDEVNKARIQHVEQMSVKEMDELSVLKAEVAASLIRHETLTKNIDLEFESKSTMGEKVADKVASFGGSWTFIISFGVILAIWMGINTTFLFRKPFDPFPYIFLNLILSCLASIQAPVIMMSQNRQEAKDRIRGENDYKTNLKAELEIQHLNEKLDKLVNDQWKHLMEIQQMQMDMIEELTKSRNPG